MTKDPPPENTEPCKLVEDSPLCQLCGERFASVAELKDHVLVSYGGVEASDEETVVMTEGVKCDQKESVVHSGHTVEAQDIARDSCDEIMPLEDVSDVLVTISDSEISVKTPDDHDAYLVEISDGTEEVVEESTITICIPSSLTDEFNLDDDSTTIIEVDSDILETGGDKNYVPHSSVQSQDGDITVSATKPAVLWEELREKREDSDDTISPASSLEETQDCRLGEDPQGISAEHIVSETAQTGDNNFDASFPNAVQLDSDQLSICENSRPLNTFMCEICGKLFTSKQKLQCHLRIHTGEKPFKCGSCEASFRYLRAKKHHEESHSDEPKPQTIRCEICGKKFLRATYLAEHLKTHSGVKPWRCDSCPKSFLSSSMLDRHARSHIRKELKEKAFQLSVNGRPTMIRLRTEITVQRHLSTDAKSGAIAIESEEKRENTSAGDGICDPPESRDQTGKECDGVDKAGGRICFSNIGAAREISAKRVEIKSSEDTKLVRWECGVCGKTYCSKRTLFQHSLVHSGEKKFQCSKCDAVFARRDVLKGHERSRHGEGPQDFQCNICDKTLKTRGGLKKHMAKHLGNAPYACKKCPSLFSDNRALMLHAATHSEERNFLCEECPATFKTGPGLRSHTLHCHVAEKPFSCASCSANFSTAGALREHQRSHVVDDQVMAVQRRHKCQLCEKRFARAQTLLEHTFTHSGAKPAKCKVCGQGFASVSNLKRHTRAHHAKAPFRCGICGEACSTRIMLRRHAMTHAGVHPLLCHVCGKRFVFPHDLAVHARTHASTRVYTCEVCSKQFTNKSSYFAHKHTHKKWKGEYVNEETPKDKLSSLLDELIEGVV